MQNEVQIVHCADQCKRLKVGRCHSGLKSEKSAIWGSRTVCLEDKNQRLKKNSNEASPEGVFGVKNFFKKTLILAFKLIVHTLHILQYFSISSLLSRQRTVLLQ